MNYSDKLKFAPENNANLGDYNIDWDTMRKYVRIGYQGHIKVWEGGIIDLNASTERDMNARDTLMAEYGMDIRIKKDMPNLFEPNTDRRIPKNCIDADYFLIDHKSKRVFTLDGNSYTRGQEFLVRWVHPNAVPFASMPIKTLERNKEREKALLAEHKDLFLQCDGIRALEYDSGMTTLFNTTTSDWLNYLNRNSAEAQHHCRHTMGNLRANSVAWNTWLREVTGDRLRYPHLCIAPFEL